MWILGLSTILAVLLFPTFWTAAVSVRSSTLLLARSRPLPSPNAGAPLSAWAASLAAQSAADAAGRHRPQQRRRLDPVQRLRRLRAQVVPVLRPDGLVRTGPCGAARRSARRCRVPRPAPAALARRARSTWRMARPRSRPFSGRTCSPLRAAAPRRPTRSGASAWSPAGPCRRRDSSALGAGRSPSCRRPRTRTAPSSPTASRATSPPTSPGR